MKNRKQQFFLMDVIITKFNLGIKFSSRQRTSQNRYKLSIASSNKKLYEVSTWIPKVGVVSSPRLAKIVKIQVGTGFYYCNTFWHSELCTIKILVCWVPCNLHNYWGMTLCVVSSMTIILLRITFIR